MECDICEKPLTPANGCTCVVCARNHLYPLRIQQATVLLEKEKLGKHVEAVLRGTQGSLLKGSEASVEPTISVGTTAGETLIDGYECAKRIDIDRVRTEILEGKERVQLITDKADGLRKEMEQMRKQMAARKAAITKKASEFSSATHGLASRRTKEMTKVEEHTDVVQGRWDGVHSKTAKARAYLCREAALLLGLKHSKRRGRDEKVKDVYHIGMNKIFDLRDLHTALPDPLSSSLNNISMLLLRVSQYLSVRLPAEITVPHKDYPRATIFSQTHSYLGRDVPFPGSTPSQSTSNSPEASRTEHEQLPRPRALYIDRPLPQLFKEDPVAYKMFIEGACLLAWDVAWLCRSQGMQIDFTEWEEICNVGRNLYQLLIMQPSSVAFAKEPAKIDSSKGTSSPMSRTSSTSGIPIATLGQKSHGAAHSFLDVTGNPRAWKLASVARVVDQVKSALITEMQGAEWEVLKSDEWTGMDAEMKEEPIIVGTKRNGVATVDGRSILSTISEVGPRADASDGGSQGRARGANGWMKLKSRNSDANPPK